MQIKSPASRSKITLPDCQKIAIETEFIVRQSSKMDPEKFVQTLLSASSSGKASYNQIAADLGVKTGDPMSRQGMEERFSDACVSFMTGVHSALLEQHFSQLDPTLRDSHIKRIFVEDSSAQRMPKSNAGNFPAHGNHHGVTAGVKIDLAYDLISGSVISHGLHGATEQDKTIGKDCLSTIKEGDLVVRDMGYFFLSEFSYIESVNANWLTRLPLNTGVVLESGTGLEKYLKSTSCNVIDILVIVGKAGKKCRLVAVQADSKVANTRRRNRRREAKKNGKTPCAKGLIRDGWHLMLTDLDVDQFSVNQLVAIYRARWGVEIQFRAWKQACNLDLALNRTSKESHMMALVIAGMIAHLIGMHIGRIFAETIGFSGLSYEKLFDLLAIHHIKAETLGDLHSFDPDIRHVMRDKRSRQSPVVAGVAALA
jgi:hypothetical protein